MEGDAVLNRKSGGFTIIGMMLSLTVTAIVGSALLAFFNRFRVCNGESVVKNQARRVAEGLTEYKGCYGIWPYFGDENGEPKRGKYGAVDYVFPVDNWIEVTRYAHELPAVLSGENRYGCNPLKKRFGEFSENEKKGEEIHRFWIYLRGKRSEEEVNRPYRLLEQLGIKVVKIKASDGNIEEVEKSMGNVSVDDIYYNEEVLFYIPKKDEKLHWQPMAQGREGWEDGGRKRRSQKVEQQDCFLGVERDAR